MTDLIYYVAMSIDGFIADKNGSVAWLENLPPSDSDYGYGRLLSSTDALIMGRKTYEQVISFGEWPYADKLTWVMTSQPLVSDRDDVIMTHQSPADVIAEIGKNFIQTKESQPLEVYLKNAKDLIKAAKEAGADAVKFQTHNVEDEQLNINVIAPHFKGADRYNWVKRNDKATPLGFWTQIKDYCDSLDIIFFSTQMSPWHLKATGIICCRGFTVLNIVSVKHTSRFQVLLTYGTRSLRVAHVGVNGAFAVFA